MRAEAELLPLPAPYVMVAQHLRKRKDCLVPYDASLYSVPTARIRCTSGSNCVATPESVAIHALEADCGAVPNQHRPGGPDRPYAPGPDQHPRGLGSRPVEAVTDTGEGETFRRDRF